MRGAGISEFGGPVETLELPDPRSLARDEVLIEVRASGVGNWDEFVRTGGWDVGRQPPMALGVEGAGTIIAVGHGVANFVPGQDVFTHLVPLRDQGTWAERLIAPCGLIALKPGGTSWEVAGAFAVPALTAEQVLSEALGVVDGDVLVVHGAGGVTGGMLVTLGALKGARVIATTAPKSVDRVRWLGASDVLDYDDPDWPDKVRRLTESRGARVAANAAKGGSSAAVRAVADGGRLATITSDPPETERDITVCNVYVRPDGSQLAKLAILLGEGRLGLHVARTCALTEAASALTEVVAGRSGGAVVTKP